MRFGIGVLALLAACSVCMAQQERVSEGEVQKLFGGLKFTEGPVWHPEGFLIFSDIQGDTIYKLTARGVPVYRRPSGKSNGLAFDTQGRLIACEHWNRRVSRTMPDGTVVSLAETYEGKRLNSPNDVCVRSDGSIYFTDPDYGLERRPAELDFGGLYLIKPDGQLLLQARDFVKPNGVALSPDEKVLYVDDTEGHVVRAFDVQPDGTLANGRVLVELPHPNPWSGPDGMKVDTAGNLFVSNPGGIFVLAPDGKQLEVIPMQTNPTNCAFGGEDGRTLYITAGDAVYSVRVKHPGADWVRRFPPAGEQAGGGS